MYTSTTRNIRITVEPYYLEEQSQPDSDRFVWTYHIRIENLGNERITVRRRHWKITDSTGHIQETQGPGVVGEQPAIRPGSFFEYTSSAPLYTPSAIMVGSYEVESESGETFRIKIPAFSLDSPFQPVLLN